MGFWRKLGKIASFAAPIVAAPFTGGASLALIGAGSGAANAALSGKGVKGILGGAALGGGATFGAEKLGGVLGKLGKPSLNSGTQAGAQNVAGDVVKKTLGSKLMDSLTSPEIIKAGIGAGLQGAFGGDDGPQQRQHFTGAADPQHVLEQALKLIGTGGQAQIDLLNQPFRRPTVAPIDFKTHIEGLPFDIGLQHPGLQGGTDAPASSPALDELRAILASLGK